ncbi:P-loop NTPase family protein [Couchioplanes azureus]|uniref:kinase n=1 Tax=Couchioplanes caeruleus TaxID=56438 RepID=UPI001E37B378|nr:kinase [Couchioplanes caeruleus]
MTNSQEIERLRQAGDLIWENRRYNSAYFVDRDFLFRELAQGWPVIHLGQPLAISAIKRSFSKSNWLVVYLWCPRDVAERRAIERGTGDVAERMAAWDATESLTEGLKINTSRSSPIEAAVQIDAAFRRMLTPT